MRRRTAVGDGWFMLENYIAVKIRNDASNLIIPVRDIEFGIGFLVAHLH